VSALPKEFATLLSDAPTRISSVGDGNLLVVPNAIRREAAARMVRLLDRHIRGHLRLESSAIPPEAITSMTENYAELLPKTVRFKTLTLNRRGPKGYAAAEKIGLIRLMKSDSLRAFAEAALDEELSTDPNVQVICYEEGDYSGPHNDHHPEDPVIRDGYVDLHINLPNDSVAHQWLVCENQGMLTEVVGLSQPGTISIYRLPFWHLTTPLVAKRGRHNGRRWLLLATFARR
jgi:hypothetical protein